LPDELIEVYLRVLEDGLKWAKDEFELVEVLLLEVDALVFDVGG
jgi:hypothetical protein